MADNSIDENALEAALDAWKDATSRDAGPASNWAKNMRDCFQAAIGAYEAARPERNPWRPIEEAPHQQHVLTLWQSGLQQVMYKTEYCPPLVSSWRFANGPGSGQQGPWPIMFRAIDPPTRDGK